MKEMFEKYSNQINQKRDLIGTFHHTTGEIVNNFEIKVLNEVLLDLEKLMDEEAN